MHSVSFSCGRAQQHVASGSPLPWDGHSLSSSSVSVLWQSRRKTLVHTLVPQDFGVSQVACPVRQPAANSCQRCWITEQYPVERTSLEYMPVSTVYKRQNALLVSMLTALPSFLHSGVDVRVVQLRALRHCPSSRSREPHPRHRGKMVPSMDPT